MKQRILILFLLTTLLLQARSMHGQDVIVNLGQVDGLDITPDNILNFQIISRMKTSTRALVHGTIQYRSTTLSIAYQFECNLQPGVNMMNAVAFNPHFTYSVPALRELFEQYKKLPEGIYQYCVSVKPNYNAGESIANAESECVYHKSADVFLINLIDPDDNAKIYEYNPMLSWTVNYPFASQLQYRIRVAPINKGQNTVGAITRNNPVYDEKNLMQMSITYPVYAKPLEVNQPYAWTVDAYYKGILLGGAEPWKFTIIKDSLLVGIPKDPSYVDIKKETSLYNLYAPGILKLKYNLDNLKSDSLKLSLLDKDGKSVKMQDTVLTSNYGDNRFVINFYQTQPLKHLNPYTLLITSQSGRVYKVLFKYVNPELLKQSE
jgi:hypothetical protein